MRAVYVWRIRAEYPDGVKTWSGMTDPPQARRYLSKAGAEARAALIRERGGVATVERSNPVTWPDTTTEGDPQ